MVGRLARPVIGLILPAMLVGVSPAASADPEPPPLWRQVVELVRGIGSVVEATGHTAQVVRCVLQARACDDQALGTDSVEEAEALEAQAAGLREQADEAAAAVGVLAGQADPPPTGDGTGRQPPGWAGSIIGQQAAATQALTDEVGWLAGQVEERADDLRRAREAIEIVAGYQQRLIDAASTVERVGQPDRPLPADLADIDQVVKTTAWLLERLNEVQGTYRTSAGGRRQIDRTRREAIAAREQILDKVISHLDGHLDRLGDLDDTELQDVVDRLHEWVAHLVEQAELCENGADCDRLLDQAEQLLDRSERFVDEIDRRAFAGEAEPDPAPWDRIHELRAEIDAHGMDAVLDRFTATVEKGLAERAARKAARAAAEEAAQAGQASHQAPGTTGERDGTGAAPAAETPAGLALSQRRSPTTHLRPTAPGTAPPLPPRADPSSRSGWRPAAGPAPVPRRRRRRSMSSWQRWCRARWARSSR
jgi:hypothetical protein